MPYLSFKTALALSVNVYGLFLGTFCYSKYNILLLQRCIKVISFLSIRITAFVKSLVVEFLLNFLSFHLSFPSPSLNIV